MHLPSGSHRIIEPAPNTVSSTMLAQAMIFTTGRSYSGRNKELFNALHLVLSTASWSERSA